MEQQNMNRRKFMGTSAAIAAATIVPRRVLGGPQFVAPSDKINVAYVGTGTQGIRTLFGFLDRDEIQVVSVCDCNKDSQNYPEWYKNELRAKIRKFLEKPNWGEGNKGCRAGREVGREIVETHYAKKFGRSKWEGLGVYEDFRDMLAEQKDIDGVAVMTPEHMHGTIAYHAMKNGKHVIMHKPLSNRISEMRLVVKTAEETGLATHMFCSAGSQTTATIKEWIQAGAIGQVREVHNWTSRPFWPQGMTEFPKDRPPIPRGFNWDLWLGPEQYRHYNPAYTNAVFRGWYDFGTGPMGDMGHYSGYQIWNILELDTPTHVEASRSEYWDVSAGYWVKQVNKISFPRAGMVHWEFPARGDMAPVTLNWYDGGLRPPKPKELVDDGRDMPEEGLLFVGDSGKILADFSGGSPRIIPEKSMQAFDRPPKTLPRPDDELTQWIRACRGEKPADARFQVIRPITETILLGTIALRVPQRLEWDAKNMTFTNSDEANTMIHRRYRKGWQLPV